MHALLIALLFLVLFLLLLRVVNMNWLLGASLFARARTSATPATSTIASASHRVSLRKVRPLELETLGLGKGNGFFCFPLGFLFPGRSAKPILSCARTARAARIHFGVS